MRKRGIYNIASRKARRRELRTHGTAAESVLWAQLKGRKLDGKKFRRQASIGPFIVDFYCPECRLALELDGAGHFSEESAKYDVRRTMYLGEQGIRVLRFESWTIARDLERVLDTIRQNLTTPSAPDSGEA